MKEVLLYYEIRTVREYKKHFESTGSDFLQITHIFGHRTFDSVEFLIYLIDK